MKSHIKILLWGSLLLLVAQPSFADLPASLRVYTAHGEIDTIYQAFTKLSLIVSDARYIGACFALLILSFLVTAYHVFGGKGIIGQMGPSDMLSWIFSFLVACVLLRAFIIPTTDVTIDDVTMGQTMTVADVPDGIVLLVNGMNIMENALLEIVNTSNTPDSFINNPGGSGFNIISKMFDKQIDLSGTPEGTDMAINIQNYIKDCLAPALSNNTNGLNIDELMNSTNYTPAFAKAANPAVFTSLSSGTVVTCGASYTTISTYFNGLTDSSPSVQKWATRFCSEAGWFDKVMVFVGIPKLTTCWNNATNFVGSSIIGTPVTLPQIFRQTLITQELYKYATSGDLNAGVIGSGNYHQGNAMVSAGLLSAEWMPQIKNMMLAAFLGMSPFLLIFLATTIWKKVLGFMFGCLTFFTVWGICDAVMHDFAMAKAIEVMRGVAQGQLGMKSIIMFSSESMKAYAVFGQYKVWSMGLAVFFSGALVKGGSELGRIAAGRASDMKSVGDAASADMTDPVRNASKREGLASAVPTQALYNSNAYDAMSSVAEYNKKSGVYGAQAIMNSGLGGPGHTPETAAQNTGRGKAYTVTSNVSAADALDAVSGQTGQSGYDLLAKNATVNLAKTSGEAQAYSDEGGGSIAGVVDLARRAGSFDVGEKLSKMGAYEKGAALTGKSVRGLQNEVAGAAAAKTIQDAASFRESAAKHYGPGDQGMYDMAKDFAQVNNETGVGRNKALRDVAEKHFGGAGNIAAAEQALQTFNRLKNVADREEFAKIARKHFGNNDNSEFKMMSVIANASAARAAGTALSDNDVAKTFFHGDKTDMNRAFATYQNLEKGSEIHTLGGKAKDTAIKKGEYDASQSRAIADYIKTMGVSGAASPALLSKFGDASRSLMSEIASSKLSGRALSSGAQNAYNAIKGHEQARAQFNAFGASSGASYTVQKGDDLRGLEKKFGMPIGSIKEGMPLNIKTHMDRNGNVSFDGAVEGSSGYNISRNKNDVSRNSGGYEHGNMFQALTNLNSGKTSEYARELAEAKAKGGGALKSVIASQARDLAKDINAFVSSSGISTDSSDVGLGISKSGTGGGFKYSNTEQGRVDLISAEITQLLQKTVSQSGDLETNYIRNVGGYVSGINKRMGKEDASKWGLESILTRPLEATKDMFKKNDD